MVLWEMDGLWLLVVQAVMLTSVLQVLIDVPKRDPRVPIQSVYGATIVRVTLGIPEMVTFALVS